MAEGDLLNPGYLEPWEGQFESAALPGPAVDGDCAAVKLYQMLGDGQAKACAFASSSSLASFNLVELIEDRGLFVLRYADPRIANGHVQKMIVVG